jgi:biopolymer transport protein ExbD
MGAAGAFDPAPDINTTPLIDVLLVLLIMFVITIPVQTHQVPLDLPGSQLPGPPAERHRLVVDAGGGLAWDGRTIDLAALPALLGSLAARSPQPEIHFEPHGEAPYARVDEVLAVTRRAGVARLGFVGNERYARF